MPTSGSATGLSSRAAYAARLGGLVVLLLVADSTPASAHENHVVPSTPPSTATVRWVVLWLAALAVGVLLRRGRQAAAGLVAVSTAIIATATSTWGFALVSITHRTAAALWLGAVLALLSSGRPRRRSLARVAVPAAVAAGASGLVLARMDRVGLDTFTFDRLVLVKAGLFAVTCLAGLLGRRTRRRRWPQLEVLTLTIASVLGSLLVLVPAPPPSGSSLVSAAGAVAVTVVPQRPGLNLVHVDSDTPLVVAGHRTTTRPGTRGQWALVRLPPGRSVLKVGNDHVLLDTGHTPAGSLVAGPDGPECASAVLGAALARRDLTTCPADHLREQDRQALLGAVTWLKGRGVRHVSIATDSSPRSRQAAQVLRRALKSNGIAESAGGALIVTGGWSSTEQVLTAFGKHPGPPDGLYVAPWDLTGPLLTTGSSAAPLLALPFDPNSQQALDYLGALPQGETPTASGLAAFGAPLGAMRIWATTPASIFPRDLGHDHTTARGWFPGGALVAIA